MRIYLKRSLLKFYRICKGIIISFYMCNILFFIFYYWLYYVTILLSSIHTDAFLMPWSKKNLTLLRIKCHDFVSIIKSIELAKIKEKTWLDNTRIKLLRFNSEAPCMRTDCILVLLAYICGATGFPIVLVAPAGSRTRTSSPLMHSARPGDANPQ